jgi:hypothetical protein
MKKRYAVNISGDGGKPAIIQATNRAMAAKEAIQKHDRTVSGAKKSNGQKDKIGWTLTVHITRLEEKT